MVITQPRPRRRFPLNRRTISYSKSTANDSKMRLGLGDLSAAPTTEFLTIIEVVDEAIDLIEILDDHETRASLLNALPDEESSNDRPRGKSAGSDS
jgi:hypothetical protein